MAAGDREGSNLVPAACLQRLISSLRFDVRNSCSMPLLYPFAARTFVRYLAFGARKSAKLSGKGNPGAGLLGPVHRRVRAVDQFLRGGAVLRESRDADACLDACADGAVAQSDVAWRLDRLDDLLGDLRDVRCVADSRQQVQELI